MANLNRVFLIGNLTRDPELRFIPSGTPVASFGLAINTTITRPGSEGSKEEVCFVRVVVWGKQAESCKQYLTKGRLVFVEGRLIYRSWEQDGRTRSTLEVRANRVQFLGPRRGESPSAGVEPSAVVAEPSEAFAQEPTEPTSGESTPEDEPPF